MLNPKTDGSLFNFVVLLWTPGDILYGDAREINCKAIHFTQELFLTDVDDMRQV